MESPIKILIIGKTGSGKTHLLCDLLKTRFKKKFTKIFLFCPTMTFSRDNIKHFSNLGLSDDRMFDIYDESICRSIYDLKITSEEMIKEPWLIIFDDCQSEPGFKSNDVTNISNEMAARCRHRNISTIYLCQSIGGINPIVRSSADEIYLFPYQNRNDHEKFYREFGKGTKKEFLDDLDKCTGHWVHLTSKILNKDYERKIIDL